MYEQIISFINSLIPTRLETYVGGGVAFVGVILQHFFGEWNNQMEILLILMIIDYLTGLSAAFIQPNVYLDSKKDCYIMLGRTGTSGRYFNRTKRTD